MANILYFWCITWTLVCCFLCLLLQAMEMLAFPMLNYLVSPKIFLSQFSSPSSCSVGHISRSNDLESEISSTDEGTVHNPLATILSWAKWKFVAASYAQINFYRSWQSFFLTVSQLKVGLWKLGKHLLTPER